MPNHVTNRCRLEGSPEDIAAFMELMISDETVRGEKVQRFDFERIIPMPDCLKGIEDSSLSKMFVNIIRRDDQMERSWNWMNQFRDNCLGSFADGQTLDDEKIEALLEAANPEALRSAKAMILAINETGSASWYDWSISNWGTKWNAYSLSRLPDEPNAFKFDTAWSPPVPVFEALAQRFPNLGIYCVSFDEGWGFACEGWFNPPEGEAEYTDVDPTDEMYEKVYGAAPEKYDDEDEDEDQPSEGLLIEVSVIEREVETDGTAEDDGEKPIWSA